MSRVTAERSAYLAALLDKVGPLTTIVRNGHTWLVLGPFGQTENVDLAVALEEFNKKYKEN